MASIISIGFVYIEVSIILDLKLEYSNKMFAEKRYRVKNVKLTSRAYNHTLHITNKLRGLFAV